MSYEEDFLSEEFEEVDIDGRVFKLKILSGKEADKIANDSLSLKSNGNYEIDIVKQHELMLQDCVLDAPYDVGGKKFVELNRQEKAELLSKLKIGIYKKLIDEINRVNTPNEEVKKN